MADYSLTSADPDGMQMAQALRQRRAGQQQSLMDAGQQANRFNRLAAVMQMANNPAAAAATKMAASQQQDRFNPVRMGNQGFMLPGSGEFVESPMYTDEKNAAREAAEALQRERLEAQGQAQKERLSHQEQMNNLNNSFRMTMATLMQAGMNERAAQDRALRQTIAEMNNQTRLAKIDEDKAKNAKGKTLPGSEVRQLSGKEEVAVKFGDISTSFKDDFSGMPLSPVAKLQNIAGKFGMDAYRDQSNWWQNYNEQKNQVRNELFGSALTATEKAAFDAANVTEGMDPKEIRRRLKQQSAAAARAHNKLLANYGKAGYNTENFTPLVEPPAEQPGQPPTPAASTGFKVLSSRPKGP